MRGKIKKQSIAPVGKGERGQHFFYIACAMEDSLYPATLKRGSFDGEDTEGKKKKKKGVQTNVFDLSRLNRGTTTDTPEEKVFSKGSRKRMCGGKIKHQKEEQIKERKRKMYLPSGLQKGF